MFALRSTVRHLTAAPWLTAVIVISLALGTGANEAVYRAVDALLFRLAAYIPARRARAAAVDPLVALHWE